MSALCSAPWRMQVSSSPEGHRIRLPLNWTVLALVPVVLAFGGYAWYQFAPQQLALILAATLGLAVLLRLWLVREVVVVSADGVVLERHSAFGRRTRRVAGEQLWDVEIREKTETHRHHHHQDNPVLELLGVGSYNYKHVYSRTLWLHNYGDAPLELGDSCTEGELEWLRQAILDNVACPAARGTTL